MMPHYIDDTWFTTEPDWSWRTFDLCIDDERYVSCNRCFERIARVALAAQDEHAEACLARWLGR